MRIFMISLFVIHLGVTRALCGAGRITTIAAFGSNICAPPSLQGAGINQRRRWLTFGHDALVPEYSLVLNEDQIAEMGGDPTSSHGITEEFDVTDFVLAHRLKLV